MGMMIRPMTVMVLRQEGVLVEESRDSIYYISIIGKMFALTLERSHYEYDIPRRLPGEDSESLGSFVETLFQLELCTRALIADRLEMVKEFIDLSMRECPEGMVLTQSNLQLRYEMRHIEERDWFEIGRYLYEVHGDYHRMEGSNVRYI